MTVDLLDPAGLAEILDTLRAKGVASATLAGNGTTLAVTFEPQFSGPMPGDAPTPGGWKSPPRLDAVDQFDEPREAP